MRKTRPGADRISMRLLDAAISSYASALPMHVRECVDCMRAGTDAMAHCSKWWEIKAELHKLQRQRGFAINGFVPGQDMLPGMETEQ